MEFIYNIMHLGIGTANFLFVMRTLYSQQDNICLDLKVHKSEAVKYINVHTILYLKLFLIEILYSVKKIVI